MSKNIKHTFVLCLGVLFLVQCERPNSPDFSFSRTIEFPLLNNRTVTFIGESDALIDTTSETYEDLFVVDGDSFVTLNWEDDVNLGNLDNVIPAFDFETELLESTIGPIMIGDFSSDDDLGSVSFQELTGYDSNFVSPGDQLPAGSTPQPVNVSLDTDYFVSATIIDGGLNLELRNELGIDITEFDLVLYSGNTFIGSLLFTDLLHNTDQSQFLNLDGGTVLEELNVDIDASWEEQELNEDPDELIIREVGGINLVASEVVAVIGQQNFSLSDNLDIAIGEFRFTSPDHFVEIESGSLIITEIKNRLDVDLDVVELSFPDIRSVPFNESDSLVIRFENDERFARNNLNPDDILINLSGYRIYGEGNKIDYNLFVQTEETRSGGGSEPRTINEIDGLSASFGISDFQLTSAFGIVSNRKFFLNEDDSFNGEGVIDIYNDNEAERIEIDGLQDFSGKLKGLEFTDTRFNINYQTNIDLPVTITGAFMGVAEGGEEIYLSGAEGTETYVNDSSVAEGLTADGTQLDSNQLIRFNVNPASSGIENTFTFDRDNSNVVAFLNQLPSEVRFIGITDINNEETEGTILNPVEFDPSVSFDIPLAVQTVEEAVYTDTLSSDLSDLPGEEESTTIEEGTIQILYTNHFPLQVLLDLKFLNDNNELITSVPLAGEQEIVIGSSDTDSSGFSTEDGHSGQVTVSLSREQLRELNRTEKIGLSLSLLTHDQQEVRLKSTDRISISLSTKFIVQSPVN